MDASKNYKPYPIPSRRSLEETAISPVSAASSHIRFEPNPFTEIEISADSPDRQALPIPQASPQESAADDKRALFYAMRQLVRENISYQMNQNMAFYHQAQFMKDFEDDFEESEPFSCYYPNYQQMTYRQLRTYFTWRTKVRQGNIANTSLSYAFVYIYELINQIGVSSPEEGLERLLWFWQTFHNFDAALDRYVLQWLKDYHIYYPMNQSFREFAAANGLTVFYPAVFCYDSGAEDSFNLFAAISKYDIKKSIFYTEQTHNLLSSCFYFILQRLRERFSERKSKLEDFIFNPSSKESVWTPFARSLFFSVLRQQEREITLSDRETYCFRNNKWGYKTALLTDQGRELVGYVMKEMESCLRKRTKYKYRLSADPLRCDAKTRLKLEKLGIVFPKTIQDCVAEYYALSTRRTVSVDVGNLNQIRRDSQMIQEKLILPEEEPKPIAPVEPTPSAEPSPADMWSEWSRSLSDLEREAVKIMLRGQDIRTFAVQNRIMLEVLADSINQKAMDFMGDTILELDDTPVLYEDYTDKLAEILDVAL